jgi:hypothetical protein
MHAAAAGLWRLSKHRKGLAKEAGNRLNLGSVLVLMVIVVKWGMIEWQTGMHTLQHADQGGRGRRLDRSAESIKVH